MVRITFYGGVDEVGGNKILLESQTTRLMLDFGRRMGFDSQFFAEFLEPRTATTLKDRITIGALPRIDGVYRQDLIAPVGLDGVDNGAYARLLTSDSAYLRLEGIESYEEIKRKEGRGRLDAILLSHAHLDHTGDIMFLHTDIPLYCSRETETLVEVIDEVTSFRSEAISTTQNEISIASKGCTPRAPQPSRDKKDLRRTTHAMTDGEATKIGDFNVRLIQVDHSVPGAASLVLEIDGRKLLYTGDIRFHGTHPMKIDDYIQKTGGGIDIMICEGTRIDSHSVMTEELVKEKISQKVAQTKGLVFVDFSWKDTTRYETVKQVAIDKKRTFVINARLAYILHRLGIYPREEEPVRVFLKRKGTALYSPADYNKQKHEYGLSTDWKEPPIDDTHYKNGLTAQQIMENPGKYILMLSFFDLGQIFDLADSDGKIPDSWFIRAQCEPFSDEMEIDEERMINWLDRFRIGYDLGETRLPNGCKNASCEKLRPRMDRSHVSGHASRPELLELISKLKPRVLMPVHTPNAHSFVSLADDVEKSTGHRMKLILPELDKTYDI